MFTKAFWKGAAERAIKTGAQAAVAFLTAGVLGLFDVDFIQLASVSLLAVVASLFTSLANPEFVAGPTTPAEPTRSVRSVVERHGIPRE